MVESDLDIVVVSDTFAGVPWPNRTTRVLLAAGVTDALEILCYTPSEFSNKKRELGIVQAVVTEGKRVYLRPSRARRSRA